MMLSRRRMLKNEDDKIYLYKTGDTCDDVTGGWVTVEDSRLEKDHILLINSWRGKVKTIGAVPVGTMCIDIKRTDTLPRDDYSFRVSCKGAAILNRNMPERERIVLKTEVKEGGVLELANYFGEYKIYNVWIEKN